MLTNDSGISLVFAAQIPDVNGIPIQLKDNLCNRLILSVSSAGTSEIVLDEKGAERLLGRGYLAAKPVSEPTIINGQVPFAKPKTLEALLSAIGIV
jgi:S-DNA-T family DNA segregation ATPase FtsK/SpoIIIE